MPDAFDFEGSRDLDTASALATKLIRRLSRHLQRCIPHSRRKLRLHVVWNFVRVNINRLSFVLAGLGHVYSATMLRRCGFTESLTRYPSCGRFQRIIDGNDLYTDTEGSYLHWDPIVHKWIRSGKVVGRSFGWRAREHMKESRSIASHITGFYATYPSKRNTNFGEGVFRS